MHGALPRFTVALKHRSWGGFGSEITTFVCICKFFICKCKQCLGAMGANRYNDLARAPANEESSFDLGPSFEDNKWIGMVPAMPEHLILTKFLPYLLNRAGVQTGQIFSLALREFRLTLPEWRILIALWQSEDQRLRDLAETTVVDYSTLSRQIAGLERAGLITRKRSRGDARALCIALTAKGRKLTARIIPIARMHAAAAVKGLTDQQLMTLEQCLNRIFENLQEFEKSGLIHMETREDRTQFASAG